MHVREEESGLWACWIGSVRFDTHDAMVDSLAHVQIEADQFPDSEVWIDFADGTSEQVTAMVHLFGSCSLHLRRNQTRRNPG